MCLNPLAREGQGTLIDSPHKDQWIGVVIQKRMGCYYQKRGCRLGRQKQWLSTKLVSIVTLCHVELVEEILKTVIAT